MIIIGGQVPSYFFCEEMVEIENELLNSLFWFLAGAISFRLLSVVFLSGVSSLVMEKTLIQSLILLRFCDEAYAAVLRVKQAKLHDDNVDKDVLQDSLEADNITIDIWRAASINGVINHFPARARHIIKFKDWRSAMNYLSKKVEGPRR